MRRTASGRGELGVMADHPNIAVLNRRDSAQGLFADGWLAIETEKPFLQSPRQRGGSRDREHSSSPLVFRNNELPGIMLASTARRGFSRLYGVRPGRRAVVATVNDHGLRGCPRSGRSRGRGWRWSPIFAAEARNGLHDALRQKRRGDSLSTASMRPFRGRARAISAARLSALRLAKVGSTDVGPV